MLYRCRQTLRWLSFFLLSFPNATYLMNLSVSGLAGFTFGNTRSYTFFGLLTF